MDKAQSDIEYGIVGESGRGDDKKILDKIIEYDCREYKPMTDIKKKTVFDSNSPRGIHNSSIPPEETSENLKDWIAESQDVLGQLANSTTED